MLKKRLMTVASALVLILGCRDDKDEDDSPGPPPPTGDLDVELADEFEEGFPGANWVVREGFTFVDEERGNDPPGLVVGLFNKVELESSFTFSTAEPVTVWFDIETPGVLTESDSRFIFRIKRDGFVVDDASFEVKLKEGVIRFLILGEDSIFDFFTDADFRTIAFSVEQGVATWSVDGQPFMTRGGFPEDHFIIEIEGNGGATTAFVVDNVRITRP